MRVGGRIALISVVVVASVMASVASNHMRGHAIVPAHDAGRGRNDIKTKMAELESAAGRSPVRDLEVEQRDDRPLALTLSVPPAAPLRSFRSTSDELPENDATREKTLAVLILMLRDGRGAR